MKLGSVFLLCAILIASDAAWAQSDIPYQDPNARVGSSRRESRSRSNNGSGVTLQPYNPYGGLSGNKNNGSNSKAAGGKPTPKAGTAQGGKTDNRARTMTTTKAGGATTGTVAKRSPGGQQGKKQTGGAQQGAFSQVGQMKEVTKEMVESMRTRKVKFDAATAADDPGIILLNPRKLDTLN